MFVKISICSFVLLAGCWTDAAEQPPVDAPLQDAPPGCTSPEQLAEREVTVSGTVVDLVTGAPVAGARIDVAKAWVSSGFPDDACPVLATLTTGADGSFGPVAVPAGPKPGLLSTGSFLVFLVSGAGRANTASDSRVGSGNIILDHMIAAPSEELAASWRAELAAGGMTDAATRGLILFSYREPDGAPAAGVEALAGPVLATAPLELGTAVRFLDPDRRTLAPAGAPATLAPGIALIGTTSNNFRETYVAGLRGTERWTSTGCLVADGWLFLEDKRRYVAPPPPPRFLPPPKNGR